MGRFSWLKIWRSLTLICAHLGELGNWKGRELVGSWFCSRLNTLLCSPFTVAFQSQLLDVSPGDKILEVGTGSGYQACVLLELGANVYTIEYQKKLYQKAIRFLPKIGYQPHMYQGDGSKGMARFAPYDGIIVTAGAPTVPDELIQQLKIGGKLVIPVGNNEIQSMVLIEKIDENKIKRKQFDHFSFVPLLGQNGWNEQKN